MTTFRMVTFHRELRREADIHLADTCAQDSWHIGHSLCFSFSFSRKKEASSLTSPLSTIIFPNRCGKSMDRAADRVLRSQQKYIYPAHHYSL